MIVKLTNMNGDDFLLNTDFVYEVESVDNDDGKSVIRIGLNGEGNKRIQYIVKEELQQVYEMMNPDFRSKDDNTERQ